MAIKMHNIVFESLFCAKSENLPSLSVFSWEPLLALNPTTGLLSLRLQLNFKIENFFFKSQKED